MKKLFLSVLCGRVRSTGVLKMKRFFFRGIALAFFCLQAEGQVLLYQETFPYDGITGTFPVGALGWANDIPDNPNRLYQFSGGIGAVFAYENSPQTTAFYTSTNLTATAGATFPAISLTNYPAITLVVEIQPYQTPANVTAKFAVQMNGTNWFVMTYALPVPGTTGAFATYSAAFSPAASMWKVLSVSGNGSGSGASIGATASNDLSGSLTGAGVVFTHAGTGGTFNFNNFRITAMTPGSLAIASITNRQVSLGWPAAINLRMQSATNLQGSWGDLLATQGQGVSIISTSNNTSYFRLSAFPAGQLQDGDFESGNLALNWQNSGSSASAFLESGGAFSGTYYLQQSNSFPYQVQTYQLVTNLPNGYYKLTAMVKNSGGFNACYLSGNQQITSLPVSATWTNIIVRGINVTNGQCLVSIYSADPTGANACSVDFIQLVKDDLAYDFLKGGDISELTYVEQGGGKFYETNGVQTDCLQILKNHGCNLVRLRLYNDPGNPNWYPSSLLPAGIQSPTNILALAARAKALDFKILLTFYYSDYWSNGKPHDWTGLSFPQLTNALYSFTTNFMMQMKAQGTSPDFVSLGNEMQGGILLQDSTPTGSPIATNNSPVNGSSTNFNRLALLLNSGYAAVKMVSPSTQVVLHNAKVDAGDVQWFFNQCVANAVNWDVIGCSYYPFWTGLSAEQARDQINAWYPNYNKPVLIMETGYNWATNRCDGYTGQLANNGPEPFPSTPLGQKQFLLNCFNALKLVNGGKCLGDIYWDPIFICVPGEGWDLGQPNVVDNTTLFDFNGHVLPVLDVFNYNN
jgi:arabinogalactan endo-1,4-beta-galactosidase